MLKNLLLQLEVLRATSLEIQNQKIRQRHPDRNGVG